MEPTTTNARSPRSRDSRGTPRGDLRVGPLQPIPVILAEHGVDPVPVLASVGLHPRLFDDPDNCLSLATLGHLLESCVKATQCRHFGLLLGMRFTLDSPATCCATPRCRSRKSPPSCATRT